MVAATSVIYYIFHPQELRSIIQWKVWHNAVHERDLKNETETQKICFDFLDLTSRSFSAVIQELHPELLLPVCVFYLVLRGLDTIEDDPSIPLEKKEPLLRGFKDILTKDGWTFDGNRPEEKDRELLVRFDNVITEYNGIKPAYQKIIFDITNEMGNGMADYCRRAHEKKSMDTVEQYDLYCHYVAGLVGEGLTRLFVEAGFGNPALLGRPALYNSMGLFLQKTNIVRDIKEDDEDQRWFWPKEIWSKHVDNWDDLFKPEHREAALNCSSEMVLNALNHADECLFYLAGLKEQSVFNFCAIPQTMAIATLELCFRNPAMFERNIKITKGEACQLMVDSTQNLQLVCDVFRKYARKIHKKNNPKDPNFLKISVACGKIEKFIETIFPSQNPGENKSSEQQAADEKKKKEEAAEAAEARRDIMLIMACIFVVLFVISGLMLGVAWMMGARFDLAYQDVKKGHLTPPNPSNEGHVEL